MDDVFIDNHADDESLNSPNFFVFVVFFVKVSHIEKFRHFASQFSIDERKQPGCVSYDSLSAFNTESSKDLSESSHKEFIIMEKWTNKRAFDDSIKEATSLKALNFLVQEQNLLSFPHVSMWQKINGIHDEMKAIIATESRHLHLDPAVSYAEQISNSSNKTAFIMSRRRTVRSNANPDVLLQIMCRLAQLAIDSEEGCLGYDIYTSRSDEGKDDVLEIGTWKNHEEYLRHLDAIYVVESKSINSAFVDNDEPKLWVRSSDGLLESNPRKVY